MVPVAVTTERTMLRLIPYDQQSGPPARGHQVEDTSSVVVNLLLVHSLNAMTNHRDTRSAHRRARSRIFQFSRP
jgi:hypothetical protein